MSIPHPSRESGDIFFCLHSFNLDFTNNDNIICSKEQNTSL